MATEPTSPLEGEQRTLAEHGAPLPQPPIPGPPSSGALPPNRGKLVFPPYADFIAQWNTNSGLWRWTFDEALRHSRENALAYRRDPVVFEALRARQMPTAGLDWHLQARNENDPTDVDHAKKCREAIEETPNLQQLLTYLLEAIWHGRYGAQLVYKWDWSAGYRRAIVDQHLPINGDKLIFRYTGEVGILVGGAAYPGTWIPTDIGRAHICTPDERQTLIVHQHEREDADFHSPEMGGRINGVGVRDRLYWFLYMKQRVLAWMMEFLERVGAGGVMVFFFESGNEASMNEVKEAAEKMNKNTAFLFPRYADGKTGPGYDRIEPSMAGVELLRELVTQYFDQIVRRLILGQSLSADAAGTGLGSGVAEFHQETLNRILKYDARNLQETLTRDLVSTISRCIDPSRRPPKWVYDVDKPNASEHLEAAMRFFEMGGTLDEDDLRSVLGLPKPKPGSPILSKIDPMNPQLGAPGVAGVPGAGMPGPMMGLPPQVGMNGMGVGGGMAGGYSPTADRFLAAIMGGGRI